MGGGSARVGLHFAPWACKLAVTSIWLHVPLELPQVRFVMAGLCVKEIASWSCGTKNVAVVLSTSVLNHHVTQAQGVGLVGVGSCHPGHTIVVALHRFVSGPPGICFLVWFAWLGCKGLVEVGVCSPQNAVVVALRGFGECRPRCLVVFPLVASQVLFS